MCKTETQYLEELRRHASDTRSFLSNSAKIDRERTVCRAFLRSIGTAFEESELIAPASEPTDVVFRSARFQITEILDQDRKRGDDWKRREQKYLDAASIGELSEPYTPSDPISLAELVPKVVQALSDKSNKYGDGCCDIDALVYVNLKNYNLTPDSEIPNLDKLKEQKWRSVSLLYTYYGVILFAVPSAPDFLVAKNPGQYSEWEDVESIFEK